MTMQEKLNHDDEALSIFIRLHIFAFSNVNSKGPV